MQQHAEHALSIFFQTMRYEEEIMTKDTCAQDSEVIMITLDQMGQTIEVMTEVVRRLRQELKKNGDSAANVTQIGKRYPVRKRLLRPQRRILH